MLVVGEPVVAETFAAEFVAVAERFEDDTDASMDDVTGILEEDVDVESELTLKSRGVTPSQMNAKELKAISAKHSPSKTLFD